LKLRLGGPAATERRRQHVADCGLGLDIGAGGPRGACGRDRRTSEHDGPRDGTDLDEGTWGHGARSGSHAAFRMPTASARANEMLPNIHECSQPFSGQLFLTSPASFVQANAAPTADARLVHGGKPRTQRPCSQRGPAKHNPSTVLPMTAGYAFGQSTLIRRGATENIGFSRS
jgi:hypothetical protein